MNQGSEELPVLPKKIIVHAQIPTPLVLKALSNLEFFMHPIYLFSPLFFGLASA